MPQKSYRAADERCERVRDDNAFVLAARDDVGDDLADTIQHRVASLDLRLVKPGM